MGIFKIVLKITLIITLLLNSAGQGYALRPVAFRNSDIEIEEVFEKPRVTEVLIGQIDIVEEDDIVVREIQWWRGKSAILSQNREWSLLGILS